MDVTVVGEMGERIVVTVRRYEREQAENADDANWLEGTAVATVGHFHGTVDGSFSSRDFARFQSELSVAVNSPPSSASFKTDEGAVTITLRVERTGKVLVEGELNSVESQRVRLAFSFESDLSFIDATLRELRSLTSSFPVR